MLNPRPSPTKQKLSLNVKPSEATTLHLRWCWCRATISSFAMNRVKAIATRILATHNQVNPSISFLLRFQQKLYFSSLKPDSILQLVYKNEWSEKLENELEKQYRPSLTHETVVYVFEAIGS